MKEEGGMWRHEQKYVCTVLQMKIVESRIRPLLKLDSHTGQAGRYSIRSLYFDDEWNSCYRENEDGTDPREKFRIRIYNASDARITLELKQKRRGMTRKLSCPMSREQCKKAIAGELLENEGDAVPLFRKFIIQQRERKLRPKVIVEYERVPYICRLGNVRVTLDENLTSSSCVERFLEPDYRKRPVMPEGHHVLEVKYDEFLPDPVRQALAVDSLQRTSFSKYYLCRTFSV